ncbi:MAG: VacJ family lipoprotein [Pseudomonadota bacterium]|nr:VacJ family lipoprotein [Pseudomonadota bacterium]
MLFFLSASYSKATEECFENLSRSVFKFNLTFDEKILEPIAKGYSRLPQPLKTGTNNFTSNISNLLSIPNSILQGNFKEFGHSVGSVFINSTIGILGFLNPAEKIGLKPSKEDVGQTLGKYGIGQGCYYVLPILGPTTLRDSLGLIADSFIDPFAQVTIRDKELLGISGNHLDYYSVKGTSAVDFRSENLTNFESLEKNSIDLYSSFKSIYLQDRENKVKNSTSSDDDWGSLDK